jgi:hypothetical protein
MTVALGGRQWTFREGIEPPTRGFSVRCSDDKKEGPKTARAPEHPLPAQVPGEIERHKLSACFHVSH